ARDRRLADDSLARLPLRGDPGITAGHSSSGGVGDARRQSGQGRRRQPVRRRKEQHPFESWAELEGLATAIGPRYGPMILFAAATGLRPAEWIGLEKRDVDREERLVYVRRSFTRGELKFPKTEASMRAVPLQARALDALDRIKDGNGSPLLFPG